MSDKGSIAPSKGSDNTELIAKLRTQTRGRSGGIIDLESMFKASDKVIERRARNQWDRWEQEGLKNESSNYPGNVGSVAVAHARNLSGTGETNNSGINFSIYSGKVDSVAVSDAQNMGDTGETMSRRRYNNFSNCSRNTDSVQVARVERYTKIDSGSVSEIMVKSSKDVTTRRAMNKEEWEEDGSKSQTDKAC